MRAFTEELFGPVAVVYKVGSPDEAVALANDSSYGLSGSVWSTDVDAAQAVADRLDVGMAMVNEHGTTLPGLPFGGVKRSGFGRELGLVGHGRVRQQEARPGRQAEVAPAGTTGSQVHHGMQTNLSSPRPACRGELRYVVARCRSGPKCLEHTCIPW